MTMLRVQKLQTETYIQQISNHAETTLFHYPHWHNALIRGLPHVGVETEYFGLIDQQQRLQATFPIFRYRKYGMTFRGIHLSRLATPAILPLLRECSIASFLHTVGAWARQQRFSYFRIVLPSLPETIPWSPDIEEHRNLELPLDAPLEELWLTVRKKTRYEVRRAIKMGVRIHVGQPDQFIHLYQPMLESTYRWQGLQPNVPATLYQAILDDPFLRRHLRLVYATHSGKAVSAAWFFHDRQRSYYWDAASLPEARPVFANHLIQWIAIRWAKRHGLNIADMVGSEGGRRKERPGIGHFKRSFGATMRHYPVVVWQGRGLRTALHAYRWLRQSRSAREAS